jgi:glutamate--cysteine ligase
MQNLSDLLSRRLALLGEPGNLPLLSQSLHGIERECLRVDAQADLALTAHPASLGSALTHPQITTDYSESLLEFITGTRTDPAQTLGELDHIHRFVYSRLDQEYLWSASMPCRLPEEPQIPIARYGSSHIGQLKYVYRKGLALRYGKTMQCIAGIHYNFSLAERIWPQLQGLAGDSSSPQDFQSASYIALIRNFRRYSWLLMYLFGASPALDANFMRDRPHGLQKLDEDTLFLPWATSLRMSDLGYQSTAQSGLTPCYNDLESYTDSLRLAVATPYAPYAQIGTRDADGEWQQLNTNILQIENEYYSNIRPKRVTYSGERPVQALMARGVQYIEVRCLDINPFLPLGIDLPQARFLDAFLLYCALQESPRFIGEDCPACSRNFSRVVKQGRQPGLGLERDGQPVGLQEWGLDLLEEIRPIAELLDRSKGGDAHVQALELQRAKVLDPALTPSAQVLAQLRDNKQSYASFAMQMSLQHAEQFRSHPLTALETGEFERSAALSLAEQDALEQEEEHDFENFVAAYQASILGTAI